MVVLVINVVVKLVDLALTSGIVTDYAPAHQAGSMVDTYTPKMGQ